MVEIAPLAVAGIDLAAGTTPVSGHVRGAAVTLAPAADLQRLSLRARDPQVLAGALGRPLPQAINTHADGIARLGPDEWYALMAQPLAVPPTAGALSVVDVSARAVGFTLEGPGAAAALMRGCPLDIARFAQGRATRTVFEAVEIQIWATAPGAFHVEVWRSFSHWLWHALAEAIG